MEEQRENARSLPLYHYRSAREHMPYLEGTQSMTIDTSIFDPLVDSPVRVIAEKAASALDSQFGQEQLARLLLDFDDQVSRQAQRANGRYPGPPAENHLPLQVLAAVLDRFLSKRASPEERGLALIRMKDSSILQSISIRQLKRLIEWGRDQQDIESMSNEKPPLVLYPFLLAAEETFEVPFATASKILAWMDQSKHAAQVRELSQAYSAKRPLPTTEDVVAALRQYCIIEEVLMPEEVISRARREVLASPPDLTFNELFDRTLATLVETMRLDLTDEDEKGVFAKREEAFAADAPFHQTSLLTQHAAQRLFGVASDTTLAALDLLMAEQTLPDERTLALMHLSTTYLEETTLRHLLLLIEWSGTHPVPDPSDKPPLVIYLSRENGNALDMIIDTATVLHWVKLPEQSKAVEQAMIELMTRPRAGYDEVKGLAEQFCTVTWIP